MVQKKLFLVFCIALIFSGCGREDTSDILAFYTSCLKLNFYQTNYFLPAEFFFNYMNLIRGFNPNKEYPERETLRILSARNVRSNIVEVHSLFFRSDVMTVVIQIPNKRVFNRHLEKFSQNPYISKSDFRRLLRYEFSFNISSADVNFSRSSANYIDQWDHIHTIMPLQRLPPHEAEFIRSDNFPGNMEVLSTWVRQRKWNDRNSTIVNQNDIFSVYTFNPANDLPVENDIDQVVPVVYGSNRYITRTGFYTFFLPPGAAGKRVYYNSDGSLDIMYTRSGGADRGTRIFLSGATVQIDQFRRVVPESLR